LVANSPRRQSVQQSSFRNRQQSSIEQSEIRNENRDPSPSPYCSRAVLFRSIIIYDFAFSLAPLVLAADNPRLRLTLGEQIASNLSLLTFAMVTMAVLLHSFSAKRREKIDGYAAERWLTRLQVQSRAGIAMVAAQDIDWIEAQGNYVALHVGADTYLVRQTMSRLADTLNPQHFLRIHRGKILNTARLKKMRTLPGGDAMVELTNGTELRASRTFCPDLRASFRTV
jgi:DNA-binding LytR/AlgR family response regulator